MNQNQKELTYDESVKQVMQTLPPVIRSYLSQGKGTMVAKSLMIKYGLRIDQVSILEREIMLLLMGIENPDEFTQALSEEAKLEKKVIENIVQDINTQIFVPLRERMRGGEVSIVSSVAMPAAKSAEVKPPQLESKPISIPTLIVPKLPSNFVSSPPVLFSAPKPITSNTLLEDREEPHIEFNKAPAAPTSVPAQKAPSPQSPLGEVLSRIIPPGGRPAFAAAPKTVFPAAAPPWVNPPQAPSGVVPPTAAPQFNRLPNVPKPTLSGAPAPAVPKAPPPPSKPYSTDPYREPIDEK